MCRTVDEGIHGGVNQILDQVVAPRVPIRFGALFCAQLLERSLEVLLELATDKRVGLDGGVMALFAAG